jgi:hypothetical protein
MTTTTDNNNTINDYRGPTKTIWQNGQRIQVPDLDSNPIDASAASASNNNTTSTNKVRTIRGI